MFYYEKKWKMKISRNYFGVFEQTFCVKKLLKAGGVSLALSRLME
jgi:hypothetical protein